MNPDVVCLGETMALVTPDPPVPLARARHLVLSHAGAESNVAISLARLGTPAAWCSRLGDDALGHRVLAEVAAAGVGTDLVRLDASAPTGVMFKDPAGSGTSVLYRRVGSAASLIDESDVERALAIGPRLVHVTGITPALSESCARAIERVLSCPDVATSFDVNYRPALWRSPDVAAARLRELARRADVVFVGLDEAAALWHVSAAGELPVVVGTRAVLVIKDGDRGACSIDGGERVEVPALPVEVREPVGAGDAFAAGWLHGYLAGWSPVERLRLGHLVAAGTLGAVTDHAARLDPALVQLARADATWPPRMRSLDELFR